MNNLRTKFQHLSRKLFPTFVLRRSVPTATGIRFYSQQTGYDGSAMQTAAGIRDYSQQTGYDGSTKEISQDQSESSAQSEGEADDNREETEYQTKQKILKAALPFVHTTGWTRNTIAKGAEAEGMPGVAHGLFPRGGVELVFYFYQDCNQRLADQFAASVKRQQEQGESKPSTRISVRDAVVERLKMNIPYIDKWQQAMAIQTLPQNAPEAWSNLANLMDEIWHHAGDQSTDFNWYTKRVSLAAVYKSTEIFMLQDQTEGFQDTWNFLDRRLKNVRELGKLAQNFQENGAVISEGLQGMCIMARNIMGMNSRAR